MPKSFQQTYCQPLQRNNVPFVDKSGTLAPYKKLNV